jgi:CheY-like chemotaxis protein
MSRIARQLSEEDRLLVLRQTALLDSADESIFDEQTKLLAAVFGRPIAALSLVDRDRLYLKSRAGIESRELEREGSFCAKVALDCEPVLVTDATKDPEFRDTSLVKDMGVRFYAGVPVQVYPGCAIGSLCVIGMEPGEMSALMMKTLETTASQMGHVIALRRQLMLKGRIHTESVIAAGAMHQIKNTLTPAMTYLDLLSAHDSHDGTSEVREEWLEKAYDAVVHSVAMLRDMPLGKPISSPLGGAVGQSMGQIVAGVLQQIDSAATAAGIQIRWEDRSGDAARVDCHTDEMRQIVSNIVLNAMDAMPDGGTLGIATGQDGDCCTLAISDTGTGMTLCEAWQCFDPLFSTKQKGAGYGGSGIGLTIVKQIVGDHGGSIGVESECGVGTTMRVSLPRITEPATVDAHSDGSTAAALRILVVDDQPMVLKSVGAVLSALGHQPVLYGDPEKACRDFEESPADIDLAIVDLGMNPINGLELAEALRSLRKDLPVIIATGGTLDALELPSRTRQILKPFRIDQLKETLDRAMHCA